MPEKLTEEQKNQVIAAVKDPRVEIYTGKDDQILRRMVVNLGIDDQQSATTGTVAFDLSIINLNEDQEITAPDDAKPFDELLGQLGGLGLGGAAWAAPPAAASPRRRAAARRRTWRSSRSASPRPGRTSRRHASALTC